MKKILLSGLVALIMLPLSAQIPTTLYYMPGVPQSNRINPAIQPACSFYLGLVGVSPLGLELRSPISFNDVLSPESEGSNVYITPYHPNGDPTAFYEGLDDLNYMNSDLSTDLFSLGFSAGKSYLTFDYTVRMNVETVFPRGILNIVDIGFGDSIYHQLGGFETNILAYSEFAIGWSRKDFLIPNLDFGLRGKLLFGIGTVLINNSKMDLFSSEEKWTLDTENDVKVSAPEFIEFIDDLEDDNFPLSIADGFFDPINPINLAKSVLSLDQFGLAMDIGINYRPISQVMISASALDIGSINWKNGMSGDFNFKYDFEGIEANPITGIDTVFINTLTDSLMGSYGLDSKTDPFVTGLNTKLIGGVSFYPIQKIGIGVLSRTELYGGDRIRQSFTGSINMTTGKFLNLSASYSYFMQGYDHIGLGFSMNLGPLNIYLLSDNIVNTAWKPFEANGFNLWFGTNLTFGWKKMKKEQKFKGDMPLLY